MLLCSCCVAMILPTPLCYTYYLWASHKMNSFLLYFVFPSHPKHCVCVCIHIIILRHCIHLLDPRDVEWKLIAQHWNTTLLALHTDSSVWPLFVSFVWFLLFFCLSIFCVYLHFLLFMHFRYFFAFSYIFGPFLALSWFLICRFLIFSCLLLPSLGITCVFFSCVPPIFSYFSEFLQHSHVSWIFLSHKSVKIPTHSPSNRQHIVHTRQKYSFLFSITYKHTHDNFLWTPRHSTKITIWICVFTFF